MTAWVWREALDLLKAVTPGSSGFMLDQIEGLSGCDWGTLPMDGDDAAVGARLLDEVDTWLGTELFVVTDASWRPDIGPFVVPSWRLGALIRDHEELTGERFFSGDVVILSPDEGVVVSLHRAGLLAIVQGSPAPRPRAWPLGRLVDSGAFLQWQPPLEWRHRFGELYPDAALTLPSGRVIQVRWLESDSRASLVASKGTFELSYRGRRDDLDDVCAEFTVTAHLTPGELEREPLGQGEP